MFAEKRSAPSGNDFQSLQSGEKGEADDPFRDFRDQGPRIEGLGSKVERIKDFKLFWDRGLLAVFTSSTRRFA